MVYAPALQEGWMVWSTTAACTRLPLRPRSVCNSLLLSFSNSSALAEWSLLSAQPAMKSEPCVLFHTHTYWRRALFCREKRRTSFAAAAVCEREGARWLRLHKGRFVNSCSCDTVNKFSTPPADVFRYFWFTCCWLGRCKQLMLFCISGFTGTCVWSSIKCINGL